MPDDTTGGTTFHAVFLVKASLALLTGVALHFFLMDVITPEMTREMDPTQPVNYFYLHDDDQYIDRDQRVEMTAFCPDSDRTVETVRIHVRPGEGDEYEPHDMVPLAYPGRPVINWIYYLPKREISGRYFYYFTIQLSDGTETRINGPKPFFARLFTGPGDWPFYVTFEGHVNKPLLVIHITLVLGALLYLVHTLYFALLVHAGHTAAMPRARSSLLYGWLAFTIAVIPLGIVVTRQAFGIGWGGWPLGSDITDTKSEITVLYWLMIWLLSRRSAFPRGAFPWLIYIGCILTASVYLIPHSLFFVTW